MDDSQSGALVALQNIFGIPGRVEIKPGLGGLICIDLNFQQASSRLYLHGCHVTSYKPSPDQELLWMSSSAIFTADSAIRGGIPLCWPWFGPHPSDTTKPQHGYARTSEFNLTKTSADHSETKVILSLDTPRFPKCCAALQLEVEIRLSDCLWMEMRTRNLSAESVAVSSALHSYFAVSDVRNVTVPALRGREYLDKILGYQRFTQSTDFQVTQEVDRVFKDVSMGEPIRLIDPARAQQTEIETWGAKNLVVWNPWSENAQKMADFDGDGYLNMLCLEPANALADAEQLLSDETSSVGQAIRLTP